MYLNDEFCRFMHHSRMHKMDGFLVRFSTDFYRFSAAFLLKFGVFLDSAATRTTILARSSASPQASASREMRISSRATSAARPTATRWAAWAIWGGTACGSDWRVRPQSSPRLDFQRLCLRDCLWLVSSRLDGTSNRWLYQRRSCVMHRKWAPWAGTNCNRKWHFPRNLLLENVHRVGNACAFQGGRADRHDR